MTSRKLNILTYRWHVPHQYELWRLGHNFTLVTGAGTDICEFWEYGQRPMPQNALFKDITEINPKKFDLAILHFDENVLRPDLCNGIKEDSWGDTFLKVLQLTAGLPRIALCHGTPQFVGQFDPEFHGKGQVDIYEESRRQLVETLADVFVVCNSHQAKQEWGFCNSTTIWHGFSPEEFTQGTHEYDGLTSVSRTIINRSYYMGHFELAKLRLLLDGKVAIANTVVPDPQGEFPDKLHWAVAKYRNYRTEIGRYSFYANTSLRSPMPRSRSEAMMCGVIPLSLRNHDIDMFIKNGVDGFYSDSVEEIADFALYLKQHPAVRKKMHIAARKTAMKYFHIHRYLSEWRTLITNATS